jgi:hypothetical protein
MAGFYKVSEGNLLHAPNRLESSSYVMEVADHASYTYPVDGWYYFESEELAREFFGDAIIEPEEPEEENPIPEEYL